MSQNVISKYFKVFYSKDVNKKKRTFSQGVLSWQNKKSKLFNSDGELLIQVNEKSEPQINEEYVIGYKFAVLIDSEVSKDDFASGRIFISIVDGTQLTNTVPVKSNKPLQPTLKNKQKPAKIIQKQQQEESANIKNILVKETTELKNGLIIQNILFAKLRQHQIQGVQFMYDCLLGFKSQSICGCILADFMGLGKTLQTITLIYSLLKMKKISKCIVISPLTLVYVWQKQCKKWLDNKLSPLIALGDGQQVKNVCKQFASNQYRMLVLSYQGFYRFIQILDRKCDLIVFDEGHRLKNKNSKVYKKILNFSCRKRVLLTGTPLQNNLQELYTCISVVNPSLFSSQQLFNNVFQKPILNGMAKKANQLERKIAVQRTLQLANKIKQFSLRRKADTLQKYLPIKRQYFVLFKLTSLQKLWYQRLLKRKESVSDVLGFLNLFRKLFTHPQILKNDRLNKGDCGQFSQDSVEQVSFKMNFVLDVCKNAFKKGQKVIVVSYFTSTLDFVGRILRDNEISCIKLDGKVDGKDREIVVNSFEREKSVLLLSGKAGGTGLTLVCAKTMIILQPDWNPSNDAQVIGRIWRQGQSEEVNIYRLLIISSFQERIVERQQLKNTLSEKLIDESKSVNSGYDFMDMRKLFVQHSQKSILFKQDENVLDKVYSSSGLKWQGVIMAVCKESHKDSKNMMKNGKQINQTINNQVDQINGKYIQVNNEFDDGMLLVDGLIQQQQQEGQNGLIREGQNKEDQNQDQYKQSTELTKQQSSSNQNLQLKQHQLEKQQKQQKYIINNNNQQESSSILSQKNNQNSKLLPKLNRFNPKQNLNKLNNYFNQNQIILQTQLESKFDQITSKQGNKKKKKVKKYQILQQEEYKKTSSLKHQQFQKHQILFKDEMPSKDQISSKDEIFCKEKQLLIQKKGEIKYKQQEQDCFYKIDRNKNNQRLNRKQVVESEQSLKEQKGYIFVDNCLKQESNSLSVASNSLNGEQTTEQLTKISQEKQQLVKNKNENKKNKLLVFNKIKLNKKP